MLKKSNLKNEDMKISQRYSKLRKIETIVVISSIKSYQNSDDQKKIIKIRRFEN